MIKSSIPTDKQKRTQEIVAEFCGELTDARDFVYTCFNAAMTWDHIEDEEEIDTQMAAKVFRDIMTTWPMNKFYMRYGMILSVVCANAISSWDSANREESPKIKALDIFSEISCAVCFLIHGMEGVDKWMPEFRKLINLICIEDDAADGGKL